MDLGLSKFTTSGADLAIRLNAKWAHWFVDVSEGVPAEPGFVKLIRDLGMDPVPDMRTSVAGLRDIILKAPDVLTGKTTALKQYAERIATYCDAHEGIHNVELWGSAEVPHFSEGQGCMVDYPRILTEVYIRLKDLRPDVRIWTGGFGMNCLPDFLRMVIARYAPTGFNVCNLHPFLLLNPPDLQQQADALGMRLRDIRGLLDGACDSQSLASTGFGVPTVQMDEAPPPGYGEYWRIPGARALLEKDAAQWYVMALGCFEAAGFDCCCLLLDDFADEQGQRQWMQQFCGLRNLDGSEKAFVGELCDWSRSRDATAPGA